VTYYVTMFMQAVNARQLDAVTNENYLMGTINLRFTKSEVIQRGQCRSFIPMESKCMTSLSNHRTRRWQQETAAFQWYYSAGLCREEGTTIVTLLLSLLLLLLLDTRWRSCLRHYATCRKVEGLIPDEVTGFFN
jgi:hypothetical protein